MASSEHKPFTQRTGASTPDGSDFWQYVPDPSRTVVYILIAVAAFTATQWMPELAGEMEESRLQQRLRDCRVRSELEYEQWRRKSPQHDQWDEQWAQARRQTNQDVE